MPYVAPTSLVAANRRPLPAVPASATSSSPSNTYTDNQVPAPARGGPKGRRIPAPSILPPVLDQTQTHSKLHLSLNSGFSSLQKQVEELQARHFQGDSSRLSTRSQTVAPPPLPPKQQVNTSMAQQQRRPLPVPPNSEYPHRPAQHQYPASYGPSISKIRSFSAQPPSASSAAYAGLPPGAAGFPRSYETAGPASPFPLASTAAQPPSFPYHQHPGATNPQAYVPQNGTVARSFAKGGASIMLHKGFFDLLSLVPYDPTPPNPNYLQQAGGSRSGTDNAGWMGDRPTRSIMRAVTTPIFASQSAAPSSQALQSANVARLQTKGNRRISVDMVGRPTGFTHLAHASDAEQAEEILKRWRIDGNGKLAEPGWVISIKEAARTRARAQGIAQVQSNLDQERPYQPLKVTNANPDSLISIFTDKADRGSHSPIHEAAPAGLPVLSPPLPSPAMHIPYSPVPGSPRLPGSPLDDRVVIHEHVPVKPILPPPNLRANTAQTVIIRNTEALEQMRTGEEATDSLSPLSSYNRGALPLPGTVEKHTGGLKLSNGKAFKPSLETVERSVATKIYLENHYYGILKRPRDRDQRRAALERELAGANITDSQRRAIRAAWLVAETETLRDVRNRVSANSFIKLKTIGHGAFGVVSLVKERDSGQLYAMKQLRKADMLRKGQEGHVRAERDIMSAASSASLSRWIVRLVYSFQDTDHLYLVMEYMSGGDLLNLLIDKDVFEEGFAKFYIAEMVLAVQEAHKLGYIHRDIKPDNFIFSSDGHIKLSDFGLATDFHWAHDGAYYEQQRRQLLKKHGIDLDEGNPLTGGKRFNSNGGLDLSDLPAQDGDDEEEQKKGVLTWREKNRKKLAYSVVGTNSYMSPEVIRGTGYDQSCDWWSLGIILFECLFGYPPFVSKSRHITRQKILSWRQSLRFPSRPRVSREAQDLIQRLICEREDRLGSRSAPSTIRPNSIMLAQRRSGFLGPAPGFAGLKDGAEDIKAHPWFRGIDFKTLHLQEPPFKPDLRDPSDTRYFDDDIKDEPLAAPDAQPGQAEATKDPMLRDKVFGKHLLDVRKQLAFQGYTFKSPKQRVYDPRNGLKDLAASIEEAEDVRGRSMLREPSSGFRRAMSL